MIQMPIEDVISKIREKTGLSEQEIKDKISDKLNQLAGLISKEGAAHIIANELGVKIFEATSGKLKIKKILSGMRNVEVVGRVVTVFEVRNFNTGQRSGSVGSFILGDETGTIRVVLWNDQTKAMSEFKEGQVVKIADAYVKDNQGRKELHLGDNAKLEINPSGETVGEYEIPKSIRKKISELSDDESNLELLGTVVQVFEPRFFEVCPRCRKRVRQKDQGWMCDVHGAVDPNFSYVLTIFLDDGTDNIRAVFFNAQTQELLSMSDDQITEFRTSPEKFEQVKYDLLGKIILAEGRVNKNVMFDRKEFVVQKVNPDVNPKAEVKRLNESKDTLLQSVDNKGPMGSEDLAKKEIVAESFRKESMTESVDSPRKESMAESVDRPSYISQKENMSDVSSESKIESVDDIDFFTDKKPDEKKEPSVIDEQGNEVPVPKEIKKGLPDIDEL